MKRFLLLFLVMFCIYYEINAQSIELINKDGSEIVNDSILISATSTEGLLEVPVYVKNLTGADLKVLVKKYELSLVTGSEAYFCWDNCYPNTIFQSPNFLTANPNDTIKNFSGDFKPLGNTGLSKIMYTFFKNKETNDSASVTIYYNITTTTVGIKHLETNKSMSSYPNPVIDLVYFNYNLLSQDRGHIYIYNLAGKKVKQQIITNSESFSRINVSDLNSGIYIWTIEINGIPVKSEKFIKK